MAAVNNLKLQFERLSTGADDSSSSPDKIRKTPQGSPSKFTPTTPGKGSPTVISKKQLKEIGKVISSPHSSPGETRKVVYSKSKSTESSDSTSGKSSLTRSGEENVQLRIRVNSNEVREAKGLSAPLPVMISVDKQVKNSPKIKPKLAPKPAHIKTTPTSSGKPSLPPKPKNINLPGINKRISSPASITNTSNTVNTSTNTKGTINMDTSNTTSIEDTNTNTSNTSNTTSIEDNTNDAINIDTSNTTSIEDANTSTEQVKDTLESSDELQTSLPPLSSSPLQEDTHNDTCIPTIICQDEQGEEETESMLHTQVQSTALSTPQDEVIGDQCKRNTIDSGYQEEALPSTEAAWDTVKRMKAREKRKQIAMELLETERTYVGRLKIIAEDFKQTVQSLNTKSNKSIISEATVNIIFLNVGEIYNLNRQLLNDLEKRMENWSEKEQIGDVISSIAPFLKLYSMYTAGFEDAMKKLTETMAKEKKLDVIVKEFEKSLGTGLGVAHYMLEPVQRIPRYKLLLEAYFKKLPDDSPERPSMMKALEIIVEAADRTNNRIKELENSNEILAIQRTVLDYEGTLLLAHRRLIKKGVLQKSSRKKQEPRMFFLFSDVLLHTEPTGPSSYRFKNELPLCAIKMELPKVSLIPHSFELHSTNRSFILSAKSEEEMIEWMTALGGAIRDDKEKMKSLKRGEQLMTLDRSGFGSSAPILVPDQSVSMCQICSKEFTFTFRRHHCRACGRVVCGNCSPHKAYLAYMNKEERVCSVCNHQRRQSAGDEIDGEVEQPISRARIPSVLILDHEEAIYCGYVLEQDGKKWNKSWFVVGKDLALYKYKAHEDIKATETVPLPGYHVTSDLHSLTINLTHPSKKKKLNLSFKTESDADFKLWVDVIEKASQLVVSEIPLTSSDTRHSMVAGGNNGNRRRSQSLHNLIDPKLFEESTPLPIASMTPPIERAGLSSSMNISS